MADQSVKDAMKYPDHLRTRKVRLKRFSRVLKRTLPIYATIWERFEGHPDRWMAAQQAGVVERMRGRNRQAIRWFEKALEVAEGDRDRAQIFRDLGMSHSDMGRDDLALLYLNRSLTLLSNPDRHMEPGDDAVGWAATLGMIARVKMRQKQLGDAFLKFERVDQVLRDSEATDAPKHRLYNLLHQAECNIRLGDSVRAELNLVLAKSFIPEHGSPAHMAKATVMYWFRGYPPICVTIMWVMSKVA